VQDLDKGRLQVLTSSGRDESPSISANGNMIIYGSENGSLSLVSIDGRVKLKLPAHEGDIRQPIWSPFLQ
jgi:TolB protein